MCDERIPKDDPRRFLNKTPGSVEYPIWNAEKYGEPPAGFKYDGVPLSSNFHRVEPHFANLAQHLFKRLFVDLAKATKAPDVAGAAIEDSKLSIPLPGRDKPKYAAPRFRQRPSSDPEKTSVGVYTNDAQTLKSPEIVALALYNAVFLGNPYIIWVQDQGGKAIHTGSFKKECEEMNRIVRSILQEVHASEEDIELFTPKVYAYSEREVPQFCDTGRVNMFAKTDQTNGEYWPMKVFKCKDRCAPIMIVCTNVGNIDRFMHGQFGDDRSILGQMNSHTSFFRMMGALNHTVGCVDTDTDEKVVIVSAYAPTCFDPSSKYDEGVNRPLGAIAAAFDEADQFFGSRVSAISSAIVVQDDEGADVLPEGDADVTEHRPSMFRWLNSATLVTATPADMLLPMRDTNHFEFQMFVIDSSRNWVGPAFANCPYTDPNDPNRVFVRINGDIVADEAHFLAARNDATSKKLSKTDSVLLVQNSMLRDGTWNRDYSNYQVMFPNSDGRINLSQWTAKYPGDSNAPYAYIQEAVDAAVFTRGVSHQARAVLNRLQQVAPGVHDPTDIYRSLLVVSPHTQQFLGQHATIIEMVIAGSSGADSAVFSSLVIEHGIVFFIKEDGHIRPEMFARAVHEAAKNSDDPQVAGQPSASLASCSLRGVRQRHSMDERVEFGDDLVLYSHIHKEPSLHNGTYTNTRILYHFFPNSRFRNGDGARGEGDGIKKVKNVVTLDFQLLSQMFDLNKAGEWFKPTTDSRVVKLITVGGRVFGRGTRCKDKSHNFHLTDMWPSFFCSDRRQMNMVGKICMQLWGRINTVLLEPVLEKAVQNGLVPNLHCDAANYWFYKTWVLATRQLVRAHEYVSYDGSTPYASVEDVLNNPPPTAGTDFSELYAHMGNYFAKLKTHRRNVVKITELRSFLTTLTKQETECAEDVAEAVDIDRSQVTVPELVAQHTAPRVPGLVEDAQYLNSTAIPQKTKAVKLIEKLESVRKDPVELAKSAWRKENGSDLFPASKDKYIKTMQKNLRSGRVYFRGETPCALAREQGTSKEIDEIELEHGSILESITDAEKAALNEGTLTNPAGNNNIGYNAYKYVIKYIRTEIAAHRFQF